MSALRLDNVLRTSLRNILRMEPPPESDLLWNLPKLACSGTCSEAWSATSSGTCSEGFTMAKLRCWGKKERKKRGREREMEKHGKGALRPLQMATTSNYRTSTACFNTHNARRRCVAESPALWHSLQRRRNTTVYNAQREVRKLSRITLHSCCVCDYAANM